MTESEKKVWLIHKNKLLCMYTKFMFLISIKYKDDHQKIKLQCLKIHNNYLRISNDMKLW